MHPDLLPLVSARGFLSLNWVAPEGLIRFGLPNLLLAKVQFIPLPSPLCLLPSALYPISRFRQNQHGVAKRIKAILLVDRRLI
jgi:hypothetical protein